MFPPESFPVGGSEPTAPCVETRVAAVLALTTGAAQLEVIDGR